MHWSRHSEAAPPLSPVNTTDDTNDGTCNATHCSLREAINAANASAGSVSIIFAIPVGDPRHFYYTDDGVAGQVSLGNITTTAAAAEGDDQAAPRDVPPVAQRRRAV